jgi:hypothetical protein
MEVVVAGGGLGNQMFQYAFYLAKKKNNSNISFDSNSNCRDHNGYMLEDLFNIYPNSGFCTKKMVRLVRKIWIFKGKKGFRLLSNFLFFMIKTIGIQAVFEKSDMTFNSEILKKRKGYCIYIGAWTTEKYFSSVRKDILNVFSFNIEKISVKSAALLQIIKNTNSVSIHIRRGDYMSENYRKAFGDVCTLYYYNQAVNMINSHIEFAMFFVFSDDIEWAKENLQIHNNTTYVDWNTGKDSWQDMFLISKCHHNIIANSTFSWWGAWLNQNCSKMVIAPNVYMRTAPYSDIIPDEWIKIDVNENSKQ